MKAVRLPDSSSLGFSRAITLSWLCSGVAVAASVDSEIVILVDGQTFSQASFDLILDGVAQAFEQQSFIDSVAGGPFGSIAASVMIFNGGGTSTAIPWMEVSSSEDLQSFATSVRNITAPGSFGLISYVDAISDGVASIASSTFEGAMSQLTIVEDGGFFLFSDAGAEIQDYYDVNVVSGGSQGQASVVGGTSFGGPGGAIGEVIQDSIAGSVSQSTVDANNLAAVPEPGALS